MKKNSALKEINKPDLVNELVCTKQIRYYELNDKKFRIVYENSNGFSMGFKTKKCLDQYSPTDARWNHLDDITVLSMSMKTPSYCDPRNSKIHMLEFFEKMEKHLVLIYS